jgi:hypothetical protein
LKDQYLEETISVQYPTVDNLIDLKKKKRERLPSFQKGLKKGLQTNLFRLFKISMSFFEHTKRIAEVVLMQMYAADRKPIVNTLSK